MAQKDYTAERQDYKTPEALYKMLLAVASIEKFHIDVCCSEENIPAIWHFKEGKKDGLKENWHGYCFLNPPFKYTRQWIKKAVEEAKKGAVVYAVLPADRLETKYYQEYILKNKNALFAFIPGKVGFIIPGQENEPPKPSQKIMIVIFGNRPYIQGTKMLWDIAQFFNTTAFMGG